MSESSPAGTSALAARLFLLVQNLLPGWKWLRKRLHANDSRWDTPSIRVGVAVRDYISDHADAVRGTRERRIYSDGFRRCIVTLVDRGQPGEAMSLAELEYATGVPEDILKDWLDSQASSGVP